MAREDEASHDLDIKVGLAATLVGGVVMGVRTRGEAKIAEEAGAVAVVAAGNEACQVKKIQEAVSIPVIATCRTGHFVEAQILEALFVDFIDESEESAPVDAVYPIDKRAFKVPFICSCLTLAEALRQLEEGAALLRTRKGGGLASTVAALRSITGAIRRLTTMDHSELSAEAARMGVSYALVEEVSIQGSLTTPLFASGSILRPVDVALMMQLGADAVIIDGTFFDGKEAAARAKALVVAASYYDNPEMLAQVAIGLWDQLPEPNGEEPESFKILSDKDW